MKNIIKLLLLASFVFATLQSCSKDDDESQEQSLETKQELKATKGKASKINFQDLGPGVPEGSLNLETMLENNKQSYVVNVSATSILSYYTTKPIVGYTLTEKLYWEVGSIGYWRADCSLRRSDSGFSSANHFEILIYPNLSYPERVDEIKITWLSSELGLQTFYLEKVFVRYMAEGILINGSYNLRGNPIGISIAVTGKYE